VDGVYVCGSTGEGMLQPAEQRREVAEAAVELSPPGARVIVHVGASSPAEAEALARHAGRAGAAAVSSLPPVGGYSFAEIRRYYARLAEAAELPLLLYYFPEMAPARLDLGQLLELCALPGVAGVKLTDFDLYRLWALRQEGVTVFNGRDEVLAAGLLMGASGGIGTFYNLLPGEFVRLHERARAGDWEGARAAQDRVNVLVRLVSRYPLFPAVKRILAWSGLDCGPCLAPRAALPDEEAARLRAEIERAGLAGCLFGGGADD
jgi:N-acetylneuraminate lyase